MTFSQQIKKAHENKEISNEQESLFQACLLMSKDDQVLANRLLVRGADPFALSYMNGEVPEHIRTAHFQGPGSLRGAERNDWLLLAALSLDEVAEHDKDLVYKINHFISALAELNTVSHLPGTARLLKKEQMIQAKFDEITSLEFEIKLFARKDGGGLVPIRVYSSDLGFAAAYWSGHSYAAVRQSNGLTFIGTDQPWSLAKLGIKVDKVLSPNFGIIFPEDESKKIDEESRLRAEWVAAEAHYRSAEEKLDVAQGTFYTAEQRLSDAADALKSYLDNSDDQRQRIIGSLGL